MINDKHREIYEEAKTKVLEDQFQLPIIKRVFAILDNKQKVYDLPWFTDSKVDAIRGFVEAIKKPGHPIGKYPMDFYLVELGIFERRSGKMELHQIPENLGSASEYLEANEKVLQN